MNEAISLWVTFTPTVKAQTR